VNLSERRAWVCPEGCGKQLYSHQIFGYEDPITREDVLVCPPPPEPRDCCGRLPIDENDETRRCSNDRCDAWWCVCGVFTGISAGPVMCDCEYDRGEVPTLDSDAAASADDDIT
jgi:hypothetical protein